MSNHFEEFSCGCEYLNGEHIKVCVDHRNWNPRPTEVTVPDIHGAELLQGCGVIRCSQCGCPSVQEPGHDYCQTCARGEIHEVERERDEARAALEEERALNRIAWGVTANVGSQLRTANDVLIPAWQDTTAMLRLWMFAWNLAAAGMSEAIAQRDRRIAELEAALRETLVPLKALQLADGHNWSPVVREQFTKAEPMALAALSAPAQPATAAKHPPRFTQGDFDHLHGIAAEANAAAADDAKLRAELGLDVAAPPSPAASVSDGYFTCPTCKGIGSHGAECQWLQEHYPAATLGDELRKHERYLNREINYDERHAHAAREATRCRTCGYLTDVLICTKCGTPSPAARGSELLNALMGACQKGPSEEANAAFSELLDYVVGLERGASAVISSNHQTARERGSELLNALMSACGHGPGEGANEAFSECIDYIVGLERAARGDEQKTMERVIDAARAVSKCWPQFDALANALAALDAARSNGAK